MHESTDTLWRYMKPSTLLSLIVKKQAWFPSVNSLRAGDPFEGSLADDFHEKLWSALESVGDGDPDTKEWLHKSLPEDMRRFLDLNHDYHGLADQELGQAYFDALAHRRAVWCWYASDIESAAMWAIYGPQGVAVMTDRGTLKEVLKPEEDFYIRDMVYVDRRSANPRYVGSVLDGDTKLPRDPDTKLAPRPHYLKAVEYEHEKEVRVATFCGKDCGGRMIQDIDPEKLIRKIVISPLVQTNEAQALMEVIRKLMPNVTVEESTLISEERRNGVEKIIQANCNSLFRDELPSLPPPLRTL